MGVMTSTDFFPHLDETVVATARYLGTLGTLDDADVREPSVLPGWTRAHVITHVARNADALGNVLRGAQAGEVRAMYASDEERSEALEKGAARSAAELREDAIASAGRFEQAVNELHVANLDNKGCRRPGDEPTIPARKVGILRRTEVEVHHADLGLGYTAADWPEDFVRYLMKRRQRELSTDGVALTWTATDLKETWTTGEGVELRGEAADLAWWLIGRGSGEGIEGAEGTLPELEAWA